MDYDFFAQQLRELQRSEGSSATQNNSQDAAMSTYEPITSEPRATTMAVAQDVEMHNDDDTMPALEDISDSSNSDSDSEFDSNEVQMETVNDDPPLPEVEPSVTIPRPNRRARVEDDEDEDRDRRHPSERVTTPMPGPSNSSSRTSSNPPTNRRAVPPLGQFYSFPFNLQPPPAAGASNANQSTMGQDATNEAGGQAGNNANPNTTQSPFLTGGLAFSFDIQPGLAGTGTPRSGNQPQPQANTGPAPEGMPNSFAEFFNNPNFLNDLFGIEPDVEDPERAERLIKGLDDVPEGLVKRLERVGGMIGANGAELSGGDSGCAVCWEKLLEVEITESVESKEESKEDLNEGEEESKPARIVSLPCAHVFHAECLRPWFSRPKQTTCPICRFNIDPENLTFVPYRQRRRAQQEQGQGQPQASQTAVPAPAADGTPPSAPDTSTAASSDEPQPRPADQASTEPERGRTGPSPIPPNVNAQARRPNSEPPLNRRPRTAFGGDILQSFAVPGGHVVIVNHPIGILTDPQGLPTGGTGRQPQENAANPDQAANPPAPTAAAPPPAQATANSPPVYGPARPPNARATHPLAQLFGGGPDGQLPPGVVAFDLSFPMPPDLFGPPPPPNAAQPNAQPAQAQGGQPAAAGQQPQQPPRPDFRLPPMGFAGVNFGNRQQTPAGITQFLRSLFHRPANASTGNGNAANDNPTAASSTSDTNPTEPPAAGSNPSANAPPTPAAPGDAVPDPQPAPTAPQTPDELRRVEEEAINILRGLSSAINAPAFLLRLLMSAAGSFPPGANPGAPRAPRTENNIPQKDWTPPPAPGPTLRQRVEKREREAGLRCYDVSCGVGPSDEEPIVSLSESLSKQLSIKPKGNEGGSPLGNISVLLERDINMGLIAPRQYGICVGPVGARPTEPNQDVSPEQNCTCSQLSIVHCIKSNYDSIPNRIMTWQLAEGWMSFCFCDRLPGLFFVQPFLTPVIGKWSRKSEISDLHMNGLGGGWEVGPKGQTFADLQRDTMCELNGVQRPSRLHPISQSCGRSKFGRGLSRLTAIHLPYPRKEAHRVQFKSQLQLENLRGLAGQAISVKLILDL
ncbi:hypothetical protein FA15DRAFT_653475 [Coprinopsis marcescibilis]|uniref:RING-type domain-containing protein n=1 Tax=Coprinopsis marcescibilis TaxID=230819 RepID=A0A5C3L4G1_COPMA|nr:hypothetical protein FA15DRAFT_653475 [Coprinopsis marcescibilis]